MKKRFTFSIIILFSFVMCCACSGNNKLKTGTYSTEDMYATVILEDDNKFTFILQGISYSATGKYSIENDTLTLTVNDEEVYEFSFDNGKLIFESGEWAEKIIDRGAVFLLANEDPA